MGQNRGFIDLDQVRPGLHQSFNLQGNNIRISDHPVFERGTVTAGAVGRASFGSREFRQGVWTSQDRLDRELPGLSRRSAKVTERVAGETVFVNDHRDAPHRLAQKNRLAKKFRRAEERERILQGDVVQFAGKVRDGIVPTDEAIGNDFQTGPDLLGDDVSRNCILGVE